mgnify:CR=1 FL=1
MARKRQKTLSHGYSKRLLYVRPETKNRDTDITQTYNTNQTATFALTDIGAGSGASGRVGAKIRLSTLDVHCQTKNTTDGDFGRFILYVPKSITDRVAVSVNGAVNRDLFWVLWDKVFNLPQINVEPSHFHYTYRFPMSMITEYFGSGATDITKNGVYLYHVTDATTGQMDGFHRVWFQDN